MPGNAQALGMKGLERKGKKRNGKERGKKRSFCLHGTCSVVEGERCDLNNHKNRALANGDNCYP